MPSPLSLRPTRASDREAESLFTVLQNIYAEKGHLRDVTEESLEAEIKSSLENTTRSRMQISDDDDDDDVEQEEAEPPQDIDSRAKEIQATKVEMLQLIGQANNEALTALDFVSLLLSKDAPRQAEASISPALKSMAPAGTLGFDKTEASKSTDADQAQDRTATLGLNFDNLNSAADKLLDSATRLEQEMHKETNFWEQILSVSEKGWSLCRIPGRNHTIGVRFGFSEASPRFRARGLAPLKPDQDGTVVLDQSVSEEQKVMRVRILDADSVLETSSNPTSTLTDEDSLDSVVHRARNSLFDEELFFNLLTDARDLFSYGVLVADEQIIIPFAMQGRPNQKILIDLVPYDRTTSETESLADAVALALRIFLTNTYRNRHQLRSLPPPPLTTEIRQTLDWNLLQPFLSHIQHYVRVNELRHSLTTLSLSIQSAGLKSGLRTHQAFVTHPETEDLKSKGKGVNATPMEQIVAVLDGSLSTSLLFDLQNSTRFSIRIKTSWKPPALGTEYEFRDESNKSNGQTKPIVFPDYDLLVDYLNRFVCQSITALLSEHLDNWVLDFEGTTLKQLKPADQQSMNVWVSGGRLALMIQDTAGPEGRVLGAWDGRRNQIGLLQVAKELPTSSS